jgi:hypothetical protein
MNEFATRVSIEAPADDVFAFVTDFNNMSQYLPTVQRATPAGEGQIRMEGEVKGHRYDTVGWFQVHEFNRTMLWGAKGQNDYSGDLEVMEQGDSCQLTINLKFDELPGLSEDNRKQIQTHMPEIKRGLDEAGQRIKSQCEQATAGVPKSKGYIS